MKKIFVITLVLLFILTFMGCEKEDNSSLASAGNAQVSEEEQLSEKDKELKAEIAKYSDTTVDFRYNKNVTIQGNSYDIVFEQFSTKENPKKIIYKNDLGDTFGYDIKTGKLCDITLESNIVEKTSDSIDIETAQKIALEYFPDDCNVNEYTVTESTEVENGYAIWYTRYIGKYMTTDAFRTQIGFDGSIIHINDSTDVFDGKNLDFDEDFITAKVEEYVNAHEGVKIGNTIILVDNGRVCIDCVCEYLYDDVSISKHHTNIPLE